MQRRPEKPAPVIQPVVKRPPEQRRKLPPHLEAFARSDEEKLRVRRPRTDRGQVHDPREGYTVPGVSNRDARAVYDVRTRAMRELWDDGAADEDALAALGLLLLDALRLELWHARRLTSFAALAEEVVGIQAVRAEELAEAASARTGESTKPLTERATALWLRTEAGLYEGDEDARARIRTTDRGLVLEIAVDLAQASTALAGVGARHLPLARSGEDTRAPREDRTRAPRAEKRERFEDEEEDALVEEPRTLELPGDDAADAYASEAEREVGDPRPEDELDDGDVPLPPVAQPEGGVKLLTRKHAAPSWDEGEGDDEGDGETESSEEAPSREAPRREERPREERPRFGGGNDRPRFGERNDRGQRGNERPRNDRGFGARPNDRGQGNDRPRFGGNDRPRFGGGGGNDRPRFGGGNDRPRFGGGGDDRPRFGGGGNDRPRFGGGGNDRPRFGGEERPRFGGGGNDRPRFGGGNDRPRAGGDDRPRFNDRGGRSQDRGGRPVDRSNKPGGGRFGGAPRGNGPGGGKFGGKGPGGGKFGGAPRGNGAGGGNGGKGGFGARKSFGDQPAVRKPRDDDFDE